MATKTISMTGMYRRYRPRILKCLDAIRCKLEKMGYEIVDDPFEMSDDEYSWWLIARHPREILAEEPDSLDIRITITESTVRDGEDRFGVSFMLEINEGSGSIVGSVVPYNYSGEIWVSRKDPEAVEDRWNEFALSCDADAIAEYIAEYYEGKTCLKQP